MFRDGISGEFRDARGNMRYPGPSLTRLEDDPGIEIVAKPDHTFDRAGDLVDNDAMLTMGNPVQEGAVGPGMRTVLVARVGLTAGGDEAWKASRALAGSDVRGKTLGILGFGRIHKAILELTASFGMHRISWNRTDRSRAMAAQQCEQVTLDRRFREADILSVCLPLCDDTRHTVSAERLGTMKPGAIVLNVGRGMLIDEAALIAALQEARLGGAGLDVMETEPIEPGNPFLSIPNVVLTPHSLCITDRAFNDPFGEAFDAILAVRNGETPSNLVNPELANSPCWQRKLETCAFRSARRP